MSRVLLRVYLDERAVFPVGGWAELKAEVRPQVLRRRCNESEMEVMMMRVSVIYLIRDGPCTYMQAPCLRVQSHMQRT
jgi:hypothetical protein